ncbi:heme peroxidase [Peniophora sp. CONT]|nr:heme peroxidase [Peniophora sp. CONT]
MHLSSPLCSTASISLLAMSPNDVLRDYVTEPLITTSSLIHDSLAPVRPNGAPDTSGLVERFLGYIDYTQLHGLPITREDLPAGIDAVLHGSGRGLDDRKFFLEALLTGMARLPPDSPLSAQLQKKVIGTLYNDLPHPPANYLGQPPTAVSRSARPSVPQPAAPVSNGVTPTPLDGSVTATNVTLPSSTGQLEYAKTNTWNFRSADGSNYDATTPAMGMARTPYARSVAPKTNINKATLPDANEVFDRLLKRDKFEEHPGGISSMFFAFANLVIHSIFNTSHEENGYVHNNVSSYLDLSPLYGSSVEEQLRVRKSDGTGMLWEDSFSDTRLLFMPPSSGALLVLLSRNHNYIAQKILAINENGTYQNPPPSDEAARKNQDEEVFQRARLVNCGFFMQIILGDYVAAILGLVRDGITWRLDPRIPIREADGAVSATGRGNVCSIEFNLLYRWHATLSQHDTAWTENKLAGLLNGKDPALMTVMDLKGAFATLSRETSGVSPKEWTFGGLKRDKDGKFADADLAQILHGATAASAAAYKARGTPEALRIVEVLSIMQSRAWGSCSMNEFRKFIGLKPLDSFEEWNSNPDIAATAQDIYKDIDNLELHVGLQAEEAKPVIPGAGLCPGYTISRTILADAVALVRGDRFMCDDNTPENLTSWGYQYTQTDPGDGSYGGMLTRLLFTTLPDYYPPGSAYAHFPFMVPEKMKGYAEKMPDNVVAKYTWTKPAAPAGPTVVVRKPKEVRKVLEHPEVFATATAERLDVLTRGVGVNSSIVRHALYTSSATEQAAEDFVALTKTLVGSATHKLSSGQYLDIVGDVINMLPVHWICNEITGTELKTAGNAHGLYTPTNQYEAYAAASDYIYFNTDPTEDWSLREAGLKIATQVTEKVKRQINDGLSSVINPLPHLHWLIERLTALNDHNDPAIAALCNELKGHGGQRARESLAASVFAEYIPTAPIFSKVLAHVVNFYLDADRKAERDAIVSLCKHGRQDAKILPYIYEALRLDPAVPALMLTAKSAATVDGQSVVPDQRVYVSVAEANLQTESYLKSVPAGFSMEKAFGLEARGLLNPQYFDKIAPRVLYEILKLPEIHRRSTVSGRFSRFTDVVRGVPQTVYCTNDSKLSPFPSRLDVEVKRSASVAPNPSDSKRGGAVARPLKSSSFLFSATVLFLTIVAVPVALLTRHALIFRRR